MAILKKILIAGTLLLNVQIAIPVSDEQAKGEMILGGSIFTALLLGTTAALLGMPGYTQKLDTLINPENTTASTIATVGVAWLGLGITTKIIMYTADKGMAWYNKYKLNNFIKNLSQQTTSIDLKPLIEWMKTTPSYNEDESYALFYIHKIINNEDLTVDQKIDSLSKLMQEDPNWNKRIIPRKLFN